MKLFKRNDSDFYWYKFTFEGRQYRRSTKVKNIRDAEKIAAAFRTQLANGLVGIEDQTPAPTLRKFAQDFIDYVQNRNANKPETVRFYSNRLKRLLEWEKLRETRLDRIDEALIEQYIGLRRKKNVGIVSVNRELATLRRVLHVAKTLKKIKAVPKVSLLPGEQSRDFVLTRALERDYLAACPHVLRDIAIVLLDSGLRLGEALALQWPDVHLKPVGGARYGWIAIRDGKTKNAQRNVPLVSRVSRLLEEKQKAATSVWVFPGESNRPLLGTSLAHMHAKVCRPIVKGKRQHRFPAEFVLHSLRHTALTRLGEAGADSFTIMKLAGHSSVTISQRYVHPSPETVELAYDRLETLNQRALEATSGEN
ncbi:MAG TPA: tyrosine-type recombinase/integrase [Terracidiphilus sp.]|nr:tyrosine-type recombinase/integrase [Terracidiphilus sp.]